MRMDSACCSAEKYVGCPNQPCLANTKRSEFKEILPLYSVTYIPVSNMSILSIPSLLFPDRCPFSYPYAYGLGSKCCRTRYEKASASGPSCDGSPLDIRSTCCEHDNSVDCSLPPCNDFHQDHCKALENRHTPAAILFSQDASAHA